MDNVYDTSEKTPDDPRNDDGIYIISDITPEKL
jgi:hypothetical protein